MTEVLDYLDDIIDAAEKIEQFTKGMNYEEFASDEKTVDAVLRNFEVIGEAAKIFLRKYTVITARFRGQKWRGCVTS